MENFMQINGKKIMLTEDQVKEIQESFGISSVQLANIPAGDTFKLGEYEFIVLEQLDGQAVVILKKPLRESNRFGPNNNYKESYVKDICDDFSDTIANIVGADNLVLHTLDLTSDDGLKDYGTVDVKMAPITTEMYRKYVEIFDKHKLDKWWWLATAFSTSKHNDDDWIKCVSPSGIISYYYYYDNCAVRPFCILKSNIFVSK